MVGASQEKIPVFKILTWSVWTAWTNKGRFSAALALPILLYFAVLAVDWIFLDPTNVATAWVVWFAYMATYAIFAITCHRLILVPDQVPAYRLTLTIREAKFFGWYAAVTAICFLIGLAAWGVLFNLPIVSDLLQLPGIILYSQVLILIPAFYVFVRLSLIFPATAVDAKWGLRKAWRMSRGNVWRMAAIVVVIPGVFSAIGWLISREEAGLIEQVFTDLLFYACFAVEVFALSFAYKAVLSRHEEGTAGS